MPNNEVEIGIRTHLVNLQQEVQNMQNAFNKADLKPDSFKEVVKDLETSAQKISNLLKPDALKVTDKTGLKKVYQDIDAIDKMLQSVFVEFKKIGAAGPEAFGELTNSNLFKNLKETTDELENLKNVWKDNTAQVEEYKKQVDEAIQKRKDLATVAKRLNLDNDPNKKGQNRTTINGVTYFKDVEHLTKQAMVARQELEKAEEEYKNFIATTKSSTGKNYFNEEGEVIFKGRGANFTNALQTLEELKAKRDRLAAENDKFVVIDPKLVTEQTNVLNTQITDFENKIKELEKALQSAITTYKDFIEISTGIRPGGDTEAEIENNTIDIINTNTKAYEAQRRAVEEVNASEENHKETVQKINNEYDAADGTLNKFAETEREVSQVTNRLMSYFSMNAIINGFTKAIRQAISAVKELDASMTEIAVVSQYDISDMWEKLPQFTAIANDLGVAINDVYQATTLYIQQGLDLDSSMSLATETMKMARIAGIDAANATQAMTSALRGFNLELNETSAQRVNDVYSELAKITAADTQQIATAMTKVASLANSAGMSLENTAAFLAQIIETTQESSETAGTALKTVVARFSEVKSLFTQGQLTGTDTEGEAIEINKIDTALQTVGLSLNKFLLGQEGLDDILTQLAEKWNTLDIATQRYIATQAAGSRRNDCCPLLSAA